MGTEIVLHGETDRSKWRGGTEEIFTPILAEEICRRYAMGQTIKALCDDLGIWPTTVRKWALINKGGFFREMFELAQTLHLVGISDEILEIADDRSEDHGEDAYAAVYRSKLRIDTRKWLLAKLLPKMFGEKPQSLGPQRRQLVIELVKAALPPAEDNGSSASAHPAA